MVFFSNKRLSSAPLTSGHPDAALAGIPASNLTASAIERTDFMARRQRASDQGGNTLATATVIPTPGKKRIVDTTRRNDVDLFKLVLTTTSNVRLNLSNQSSASMVGSVLDSQGQVLSYQGSPQTLTIAPARRINSRINNFYSNIQPGTYFIEVRTRSRAAAQYELKLNVVDPAAPVDCGCGS